jgi:leucyl-tRNA synthetase
VAPDADEASVRKTALEQETVQNALGGKEIRKTVYVPGRIMNFVT